MKETKRSKTSFRWNGAATSADIDNVSRLVKKNNIQMVDLKFNDLPGLWQHFSIPTAELTEIDDPMTSIWEEGIGFDGSSIRGFQKIQQLMFDGLYHAEETDVYSSKRPYEFGAGGKGLDLFRIKTYGQRFGFEVQLNSRRCPNIPGGLDLCPGDIEQCNSGTAPHYCITSGGTTVSVLFPVKRVVS